MSGVDLGLLREQDGRYSVPATIFRDVADELIALRRTVGTAEAFARQDPGVDWPSDRHTDAVDAICAALDNTREASARADEEAPETKGDSEVLNLLRAIRANVDDLVMRPGCGDDY